MPCFLQKTGCQPLPDTELGKNAKNGLEIDNVLVDWHRQRAFYGIKPAIFGDKPAKLELQED
jgi:hypothetical protein